MYADLILDKYARKLCLTNLALVLHLIAGEKWKYWYKAERLHRRV